MTTIIKIPFNEVKEDLKQELARNLVSNHVLVGQTGLVSHLLEKEIIQYDEIQNLSYTDDEIKKYFNAKNDEEVDAVRSNGDDWKEVYEYWVCSHWLTEKLMERNEPILDTDFETWWGRTSTGQGIVLDHVIQEIAYEYSTDERIHRKVA